MKKCFKCGEKKELSEFYKHSRMADGYLNKCKTCNKEDVILNRKKNKDYYVAYDKARATLPHRIKKAREYALSAAGKEAHNRARKKWVENNLEKRAAHIKLGNALRGGKIQQKPCCMCGTLKSQAHHTDYSKPLIVKWLCTKCHRFKHKVHELKHVSRLPT